MTTLSLTIPEGWSVEDAMGALMEAGAPPPSQGSWNPDDYEAGQPMVLTWDDGLSARSIHRVQAAFGDVEKDPRAMISRYAALDIDYTTNAKQCVRQLEAKVDFLARALRRSLGEEDS